MVTYPADTAGMGQDIAPPRWVQEREQERCSTYPRRTLMWKQKNRAKTNGMGRHLAPPYARETCFKRLHEIDFFFCMGRSAFTPRSFSPQSPHLDTFACFLTYKTASLCVRTSVSVWSGDLE